MTDESGESASPVRRLRCMILNPSKCRLLAQWSLGQAGPTTSTTPGDSPLEKLAKTALFRAALPGMRARCQTAASTGDSRYPRQRRYGLTLAGGT